MARYGWQGETGEFERLHRCGYEKCENTWRRPYQGGRAPRYCSDACKQAAYRLRTRLRAEAAERLNAEYERLREETAERLKAQREQQRVKATPSHSVKSMTHDQAWSLIFREAGWDADDGAHTVKAAYRRAARLLHPDVADPAKAERWKRVQLAHTVLGL